MKNVGRSIQLQINAKRRRLPKLDENFLKPHDPHPHRPHHRKPEIQPTYPNGDTRQPPIG